MAEPPGQGKIPVELLKNGGAMLMEKVHNLIFSLWKEEVMPKDWNMAVI